MTVKNIILASLLMAVSPAFAEYNAANVIPALPVQLDLPTALRMADQYNPQLQRSRERINESKSAEKVTRSNMFPDLNAFGRYQIDDPGSVGSFGGDSEPDDYLWRYGVEVTQPLYSGGKLRAADQGRKYEVQAVEYNIKTMQSRVMSDIYRKFYDALLAREVLEVQKESLALIEQQAQIASNRYAAGAGPKFDVLQAQVRVANAKPPLIRAQNGYRIAIDDLRTSIGVVYTDNTGPNDIELIGNWDILPEPENIEESINRALENRPDILALQKTRDAAQENVRKNKADRSPSIEFFGNYAIENDRFSPANDTLEGWQAGVQATLDLWRGGEIKGEIARAQSQLEQIEYQLDAEKLAAELDVRTAWNYTQESREISEATKLVIAQAEEALRMAQSRYSAGALTQLDVLSSELEFTRARLEKITADRNYNLAIVEFIRAVGDIPGIEYIGENK